MRWVYRREHARSRLTRTTGTILAHSLIAAAVSLSVACQPIYDYVSGRFTGPPDRLYESISLDAHRLIEEAKDGIGPDGPVDYHVHIAGLGTSVRRICPGITDSGVWINRDYRSKTHPIYHINSPLFLSASGVRDRNDADAQYLERLVQLVRESRIGGAYYLYALDWRYNPPPDNLNPDREGTDLYVANDYVVALARCLNAKPLGGAKFVPVGSVHPYRIDAVDALEALVRQGVRHIKWLPPAQNIDPARKGLGPFFRAMKEKGITLLTHTGSEQTLRVRRRDQELANPLRLAAALKDGVRVVMLHSGRAGRERRAGPDGKRRPYFERFLEMMRLYPQNLFGEISAVPYLGTHDRLGRLMASPSVLCRIVNGSDYPLPGIAMARPTDQLLKAGYLTWAGDKTQDAAGRRRAALDEIYGFNPLLFDFVMKRTIRVAGQKLPDAAFGSLPEPGTSACAKAHR
jgi:predicted TIM-barrel fold metal-dependent hydrolase